VAGAAGAGVGLFTSIYRPAVTGALE
jgi:hypothetical protein